MVELLYGAGLRLNELHSLRLKGLDFELSIQKRLDHADVKTTEIYTHVLGRGAMGVVSPLDSQ
jgi:site-specific recombinase XerD